jgi:hypothetical protein
VKFSFKMDRYLGNFSQALAFCQTHAKRTTMCHCDINLIDLS